MRGLGRSIRLLQQVKSAPLLSLLVPDASRGIAAPFTQTALHISLGNFSSHDSGRLPPSSLHWLHTSPLAQQQAAKNEEEELKERRDTPEEPETYKSEREWDKKDENLSEEQTSMHYDKEYLESIKPTHKEPLAWHQKTGYWAVSLARWSFDKMTGYGPKMTKDKWLQRIVFLETVAGVPGMVGGMLRHMKSLRTMKRDHGFIHTLLEDAENERLHLLTFLQLKQPGPVFRFFVLLAQGAFFNAYFLFYLISPKHCHAFVGFLEEEAVKTYTHCIKDIDDGKLKEWGPPDQGGARPPEIAINYWKLGEDATMRDLILAVRADEYSHAHVNHRFSELRPEEGNPFVKGAHVVP